ncbi:LuxR C-terminal-related transcriptional regulator [Cohnella soli]|uniref:LuxR C-terminal-related transcriptional regulator n=1 Tax=Cohnella soli TaxID=425005 RepID=A0ABW0I3Q9_9BACL
MHTLPEPIILHTKLAAPAPRTKLVDRLRLIELIERGTAGKLTFVCAPAGFGKTALLGQWARTVVMPVRWVSLDETDNDPVRFWRYVAEALSIALPPAKSDVYKQLVRSLPDLSLSTFLDALMNQLSDATRPIHLILDDYHAIEEPQIHKSLSYFIEHMPLSVRLVIASRSDLPFPTARWLIQGDFVAINASGLTFTLEEAERFYRDVANLPLNSTHVAELYRQTEGWVTGLQLTSLSLRTEKEQDFDRFIDQFGGAHRNVSDYLFQEVVARLPDETLDFVLRTSLLDRLDAKACDAVTGRSDGIRMLESLKALNLFLIPLDDQDIWFRYHHLFADYLRNLLHAEHPEEWAVAHFASCRHFASRGLTDEAIGHALAAEAYGEAESLIARHAPHTLKRGELPTLLRWYGTFPSEYELSPDMGLLYAFLLAITGQAEHAGRLLDDLERRRDGMEAGETRQQLQSGLLFVKSNLFFSGGDFPQWFAFISGILDDILPHNPMFYNFNYNRMAPYVRRTAFGLNGVLSEDTEKIGKLFAGVLEKHGWGDSLISLYVLQSLAEGFYEWNRIGESEELTARIERAARLKLVPGLFVPNRLTQARLYWLRGQRELAFETIDEAIAFAAKLPEPQWTSRLIAAKAMFLIQDAQLAAAKKETVKLRLGAKDKPTYDKEFEYLSLARLLGAQRKETEALKLLELLIPQAAREGSLMPIVEIRIVQACLLDQMGQRTNACKALREALKIGESNGYERSFADEGQPMERLLQRYATIAGSSDAAEHELTGVSPEYVGRLLGLFEKPRTSPPSVTQQERLIEPLTRSELVLLALIREGASNRLIAEKLSLSEGSVKVYTSRIYGKLGVSSRTQAIAAAQRLRLLDGDESQSASHT